MKRLAAVLSLLAVLLAASPAGAVNSSGLVTVGTTATLVVPQYTYRIGGLVQNQSTVAVFCGFSVYVTTSSYSFVLKAATSAADGTGGVATIASYGGPIYCVVASGTALVSEADQ